VLLRAGRYLDTAADLGDNRALPADLDPDQASFLVAAFRRDTTRLRTLATTDQHR
jgi:hypothetical protein